MHAKNKASGKSAFYQSLSDPDDFTLTFELVPNRGGRGKGQEKALEFARLAKADGRLRAVSITENAGGHPALSPEVLGIEINALGLDVIIHLSCKDKNRNQMESLLFAWDRQGLRNLLVIAGDYPQSGYRGNPKPVFDLDTVHALDLIARLNCEQPGQDRRNPAFKSLQPTSFTKGVALSPFKLLEPELMAQYYKLHRKAAAGADYVITQLGYDARKFHEVLLYMQRHDLDLPILGNVFVPNLPVAGLMYAGKIPGCVIPDKLHDEMVRESASPDKGRKARLTRAAKLLAVLKGMGYGGAHIGGPGLTFADFDELLSMADGFADDWRHIAKELHYWPDTAFHYFEKDVETGLNQAQESRRDWPAKDRVAFAVNRLAHNQMFDAQGMLCEPFKRLCLGAGDSDFAGFFAKVEHLIKAIAFGCKNCGDCTLAELAFLCPQSGCAKYILNGACGGSRDGWCEVYPGQKRCHYVRVYERLKTIGAEDEMKEGFVPPRDWSLAETSSWVNFFTGKDHHDPRK